MTIALKSVVNSITLATVAIVPLHMASAQTAPTTAPTRSQTPQPRDPMAPLPDAQATAQSAPAPAAAPASTVELPPAPPPIWQVGDVRAFQAYVATVASEGLDPRDYDSAGLDIALRTGDPMIVSAAATERFNKLASDLALGHVRGKDRQEWYVNDADLTPESGAFLLNGALARRDIVGSLRTLLPTHQQYAFLRDALAKTDKADRAKYDRIKLNMDRWRWLPRDLGNKYIIVNVPSFYATLVENGTVRWKHRAIAGAVKTRTPQLTVQATGVVLNPSWEVPKSIWHEVAGKPGYIAIRDKNGKFLRWSQPPGPSNALGKVKFVMQNSHNIYLHDTNARSRFNSQLRALSHGCIRTEHIMDLAKELLADDGGEWTPEKVDTQVASGKLKVANFVKPLPVYIVYFSAAALNDGTIVNYADLYSRDAKVIAALNDHGAPKPKPTTKTAAR